MPLEKHSAHYMLVQLTYNDNKRSEMNSTELTGEGFSTSQPCNGNE